MAHSDGGGHLAAGAAVDSVSFHAQSQHFNSPFLLDLPTLALGVIHLLKAFALQSPAPYRYQEIGIPPLRIAVPVLGESIIPFFEMGCKFEENSGPFDYGPVGITNLREVNFLVFMP